MIQMRVKKIAIIAYLRNATTLLIAAYNCEVKERKMIIILMKQS